MRFDDRLFTVLAQPAVNPHDRAVRWRQLVELLARASDLSSPLAEKALAEILRDAPALDQQLRAAAARAVAGPNLPLPLVIVFASDSVAVSAPVLAAASLQPSQWKDVLATASVDSTNFIRSLYPGLPAWGAAPPPRSQPEPEPEYAVFEPAPEVEPEPEPEASPVPEAKSVLEPPGAPQATPEPAPEPVPEPQRQPETRAEPDRPPSPEPPRPPEPAPAAPVGPAAPIPSISEVLARIEHLQQERDFARSSAEPTSRAAEPRTFEGPPPLFRWECSPSGEIAWVDGVPRGPLIGRSIAGPGGSSGVDRRIQRAFAVRAPFRDAVLTVSGDGPAAGEWKLSGVPAFEPIDGRFAGYRGVGVRSPQAEPEVVAAAAQEPIDEDALRELIHELRTPLTAIIGFAEIIDGQYLGPADHSYRDRAAEIVAQARLLLSAIEDLDIAAQLRSSSGAAEGSTDLNQLLTDLAQEMKERAAARSARVDFKSARAATICSLDRNVLERLLRRFCFALIDVATPRERLTVGVGSDVGQCLVTISVPQALRGLSDAQLFGHDGAMPNVLASSFSLKLARSIAQTAGGDLRITGEKLVLILPRRSS